MIRIQIIFFVIIEHLIFVLFYKIVTDCWTNSDNDKVPTYEIISLTENNYLLHFSQFELITR